MKMLLTHLSHSKCSEKLAVVFDVAAAADNDDDDVCFVFFFVFFLQQWFSNLASL